MAAQTADRVREIQGDDGKREFIGAAASTTWYAGSIIVRNASGYGAPATDVAGVDVVGVALNGGSNSGSNGAVNIDVRFGHLEWFLVSSLGLTDVGFDVSALDDQTVKRQDSQASYDMTVARAQDAAAATTTAETTFGVARLGTRLLSAYYQPAAALTADNTNYATITVSKRTSAGGTKTTIASVATTIAGGTGNWTAWAPVPITLSATTADLTIAAGSSITYEIAKAGTGVQLPAGTVVLIFGPAQPTVGRMRAYRSISGVNKALVHVTGYRGALG